MLVLTSCSFLDGDQEMRSAKGHYYNVSFNSNAWKKLEDPQSDYAWLNKTDGRILLSNSFCHHPENLTLSELGRKSIQSINDGKVVSETNIIFHQSPAVEIVGQGIVDGVKINLKLLNTRRGYCYFDFISIDPQDLPPQDEIFNTFLNSVEFK
jgi:hypothetical protein